MFKNIDGSSHQCIENRFDLSDNNAFNGQWRVPSTYNCYAVKALLIWGCIMSPRTLLLCNYICLVLRDHWAFVCFNFKIEFCSCARYVSGVASLITTALLAARYDFYLNTNLVYSIELSCTHCLSVKICKIMSTFR